MSHTSWGSRSAVFALGADLGCRGTLWVGGAWAASELQTHRGGPHAAPGSWQRTGARGWGPCKDFITSGGSFSSISWQQAGPRPSWETKVFGRGKHPLLLYCLLLRAVQPQRPGTCCCLKLLASLFTFFFNNHFIVTIVPILSSRPGWVWCLPPHVKASMLGKGKPLLWKLSWVWFCFACWVNQRSPAGW